MFLFFDYLYLTIYRVFDKIYGKEPQFQATCFLSFLQAVNLLSIIFGYGILFDQLKSISVKKITAYLIFCLIILNYIKYLRIEKFKYSNIETSFKSKKNSIQVNYLSAQKIYVACSLFLFLGLAIYVAKSGNVSK